MGIGRGELLFLGYMCRKVDFSNTLTLGRQNLGLTDKECVKLIKTKCGLNLSDSQEREFVEMMEKTSSCHNSTTRFAEPLFHLLSSQGKSVVVNSLDYSDFENATIIQDISIPVPINLTNKFSCVFDGGLLEHVYNLPVAMKNAMDMVSLGGHIILTTPGNGCFGHGFYQFSRELFYSALREENGFSDTQVFTMYRGKWYIVSNPRVIRKRTEVTPKWPQTFLYVISKKINNVPDVVAIYQSDYENAWEQNTLHTKKSKLRSVFDQQPLPVQRCIRKLYAILSYSKRFRDVFSRVSLKVEND